VQQGAMIGYLIPGDRGGYLVDDLERARVRSRQNIIQNRMDDGRPQALKQLKKTGYVRKVEARKAGEGYATTDPSQGVGVVNIHHVGGITIVELPGILEIAFGTFPDREYRVGPVVVRGQESGEDREGPACGAQGLIAMH